MTDHIRWRKSSRSGANANGCVELAHTGDLVRDSKNTDGPKLKTDMHSLVAAVKTGAFDRC